MSEERNSKLADTLWRIYRRPNRPAAWTQGGNLPWNDPDFSARMLREHLEPSHAAASRIAAERQMQIDWLWTTLGLRAGAHVCDMTCGPGLYAVELARRGCRVTGIDFGPAAIAYARKQAVRAGLNDRCTFIEQDVRQVELPGETFDAALFLYGQLSVFRQEEAQHLLEKIARILRPGGRLCVELLNPAQIDKTNSNWWFTDSTGLWGDAPFLHLGERFWDEDTAIATERFYIIHLASGELTEIHLSDQAYTVETMIGMMKQAGFQQMDAWPNWDELPLHDAHEWVAYVATK